MQDEWFFVGAMSFNIINHKNDSSFNLFLGVRRICNFFCHKIYFKSSLVETPIALANLAIVASVGFVLPFSILLTNPRLTPSDRAISPCDMPFLVLRRLRLLPSFSDSLLIMHSISVVTVYHNVMLEYN